MRNCFITIGRQVEIVGLSEQEQTHIRKAVQIPNQAYQVALKRGYSTYGLSPYISYARIQDDGALALPRGLARRAVTFCQALDPKNTRVIIRYDVCQALPAAPWGVTTPLRPYQHSIVECGYSELANYTKNHHSSGILSMGTGTGKTLTALALAAKLNRKTIVLVHNNVLLNQWYEEIKKFTDCRSVGRYNGGHRDTGADIVIATFQTLGRDNGILAGIASCSGTLIIDEVQGITAPQRRKVLSAFNPEYMLGLTATPERTDGQTNGVMYLVGPILAEHAGEMLKPTIDIQYSRTFIPMYREYHRIVEKMVQDTSRNKLIAYHVMEEVAKGRKVLVLTKRIDHYKLLEKMLPYEQFHFLDADDKNREWLLAGFKDGSFEFKALFGTTSLLSVGLDIPCLDTLIIACDLRSSVLTAQSIGRVLRLFEGKQSPKIIDIVDSNPILLNQFRSRQAIYKKKGWL